MHLPVLALSFLAALGAWSLSGHAAAASTVIPATAASVTQHPHGGGRPPSLRSLSGRHGFSYSGALQGIGPIASSGAIRFDGNGNLSATYTTSINGIPFTGAFTGTYTVNADGTGAVVLSLPLLHLQANGNFVLVDDGDGTFFTSTDAGFAVGGSTRRQ